MLVFFTLMCSTIFATPIKHEIALEYGLYNSEQIIDIEFAIEEKITDTELAIEESIPQYITNELVNSKSEFEVFASYDLYQRKQTLLGIIDELEIEVEQQIIEIEQNVIEEGLQATDEPELSSEEKAVVPPPAEPTGKYAYLTFDDGPSDNTILILDCLKDYDIKATFFVLHVPGREDVYRRIVNEGHTIALHSSTHEYSEIYQTVDTYLADIKNLENVIVENTGVTPVILRFPGGSNNTVSHQYGGSDIMPNIIEATNAAGYIYFDWNVDSQDASKITQEKDIIVDAVLSQSANKTQPVILMHDSKFKTTTPEALPEIIEGLTQLGFSFEKITAETPVVQFSLKKE
ncbi:MAG: hypothetical protein ATN33_03630 [Epulopiscium sp. Nele67-Bin001]|nr:MAG: hypothetical protein ATN33_03630 [Epulopiscium sp. Nele67-Bin001]